MNVMLENLQNKTMLENETTQDYEKYKYHVKKSSKKREKKTIYTYMDSKQITYFWDHL